MNPPPLYSTEDYKIDGMQLTPKLVKSLMHKKVIKISSGGVHNICVVEPQSGNILDEIYRKYRSNSYTDVTFKGFFDQVDLHTMNEPFGRSVNSDEETKNQSSDATAPSDQNHELNEFGGSHNQQNSPKFGARENEPRQERPHPSSVIPSDNKNLISKQVQAHMAILFNKSQVFGQLFNE
mmetsp:Transcript_8703/g.14761  ORF Transcript_8703/g.14761 Transcript_8703/m.14761 type:complete len:180 (-) Transcript_8703:1593-2132(-)